VDLVKSRRTALKSSQKNTPSPPSGPEPNPIASSILAKYTSSMKITTHLDHICHCKFDHDWAPAQRAVKEHFPNRDQICDECRCSQGIIFFGHSFIEIGSRLMRPSLDLIRNEIPFICPNSLDLNVSSGAARGRDAFRGVRASRPGHGRSWTRPRPLGPSIPNRTLSSSTMVRGPASGTRLIEINLNAHLFIVIARRLIGP